MTDSVGHCLGGFFIARGKVGAACLAAILCMAGPGLGSGAAMAQGVPGSVDPGQIEKRFEAPPEKKEEVAPLIPMLRGDLAPEEARRIRFVLAAVVIEGATVYRQDELVSLYEGYLAREVSLADAYDIAAAITKKYTDDGYLLTRAVVPTQAADLGILRIRVIEGYLESIIFEGRIEGATELLEAYAEKITRVQPLRADVLERYILLMNDLPGVDARRRLVPTGKAEGAYNLIIAINQTQLYGFSRFDNRGSRFTGPFQLWTGGGINSAFGAWDNVQGRFITVTQPEELVFGDVSYGRVIGTEGTQVTVSVGASNAEPGHTLRADEIDSKGLFVNLGVNHPVIRSRAQDLRIGATFSYLDSKRKESDVRTIDDRIRALRLHARYGVLDDWRGRNNASVTVSRGLAVLNATREDEPLASRAGAEPDFYKVQADVSRFQEITKQWGILAAVSGQAADGALFLSEQFGVGGEAFGRAYDPSEIAGDDGIAAKLELQRSSAMSDGFIRQHQLFAYYDFGATWQRNSADDFSLASVGLGVRALLAGNFFASLELAKPLTHSVEALGDDGKDTRLFFVVSANY